MALDLLIVLIVIIFTVFSYFVCCYGAAEEKRRCRYETRYPSNSFENDVCVRPINRTQYTDSNNIGFHKTITDASSRTVPPVGRAPSASSQLPTPYPPANIAPYPPIQTPYPVVQSHVFPTPHTNTLNPSAPVEDKSEPPSYYDAVQLKY